MVVMSVVAFMDSSCVSLIPRTVLFGASSYDAPSLSPDGSTIAYLASHDGVFNLWMRGVDSAQRRQITFENDRSVRRYFWAPDSAKIFYLQDADGNENWHVFSVDLVTLEKHDYTPFPHVRAYIIAVENSIKDSILIALNHENQAYHDVYKLNVRTGQLTMMVKNPGNVVDWFADRFLHVRYALKTNVHGGRDIIFRRHEHAPWRTLFSWSAVESLLCSVLGVSYNGTDIYCLDNRFSDTVGLTIMNTLTYTKKVLGQEFQYDIAGVLLHPRLRTVQAYTVFKQRKEFVILDKTIESDFAVLQRYADGDISLISRDYNDEQWIVSYVSDNKPIMYVHYNRLTRKISSLFDNKPALRSYSLAPTEMVYIAARDGLLLEGYCTKPRAWQSGQRMPVVLLVHGGPWSRDTWGYDMEAQWLANRGYICLRVNYRGSTGYGKQFLGLGERQWGGTMLNDIVDAAHWAIDTGIADSARIGIMGFSYGGYTALCATTMTDIFACGISAGGPSNLVTFLASLPTYFESAKKLLYTMVGDPVSEEDFLKNRSPLFHVQDLKVPLLIAQGLNDPRVKKTESDQIINELMVRNLAYDYILFPDEGHGLVHERNRLVFYARAELFLARVLHGLYEA